MFNNDDKLIYQRIFKNLIYLDSRDQDPLPLVNKNWNFLKMRAWVSMGGREMQYKTEYIDRPRPHFQEIPIFIDERQWVLIPGVQIYKVFKNPLVNKHVIVVEQEGIYSRNI